MFVTLLIAMVVLTLLPVSLVRANDVTLQPISGSDCDPTTFVYDGHTIAEGFAASISADLPLVDGRITQIKFGCAVAGLGEGWDFNSPYYYATYTPYVKEMRVTVKGDSHYTDQEDAIFDNTGTGGSSCDFFSGVLAGIGIIFNAWQIYDWLAKIYQQPPVAEWEPGLGHGSKAIVRQKTEPAANPPGGRWVDPNGRRLQTGCANLLPCWFEVGSSYALNVTAEADIYVQDWGLNNNYVNHIYIGTYSVSFEVSIVPLGPTQTLSISAGYGGSTIPAPRIYYYLRGSVATVTASAYSGYAFGHWNLDGAIKYSNPITVTMDSDHMLGAYFVINHPPYTPLEPYGPIGGYAGESYTYTTHTTDPDGDYVCYVFDWGWDNAYTITSMYPSGATASASIIWVSAGTYYVRVKAQDQYGLWSDWSFSLPVIITGEYVGGGCPTLFVWNSTTYVNYGVINIHNPTGEDVIREVPVKTEDVSINNYKAKFRLREGWPGLNFSESYIDQVRLYAVDSQGNRYLCPLIRATHSREGNVLPQLLISDNWKTQMLLLETADLTFIMPYRTTQIQSYVFIIEGCNIAKE